jgi:DNA repair exonuclease SbcCD ATPase subunit
LWQPITLRIKNLFTHEHTVFNFKLNEMILLLGQNEDEDGGESNGSGKSVIMDAFILALTGDIYREGVNKDEYIRKGQKECSVNLTLLHSITKESLIIDREIFLGNKGSTLNICVNEKPVKDFDSKNRMKRSAQEYIYDRLGISKEDLLNFFCICDGNDSCFLTASDTKQKEVISRFSNYNKVDKIVEKIKEDLDNLEDEIIQNGGQLSNNKVVVENIKETIEELKNNNEYEIKKEALQEDLESFKENLETTKTRQSQTTIEVKDIQLQITALRKGFSPQNTLVNLNKKIKEIRSRKEEQEDSINDIKEIKSQLIVRSGKMLKCPKCHFSFVPNDDMTVKELENSKKYVEKELVEAQKILISHEEVIKLLKSLITTTELLEESENRLKSKQFNLTNYDTRITEQEEQIKQKQKEILNLKKNDSNKKLILQQQEKLKEYESEIKDLESTQEELIKKKESLNFHLFSFQKQFRNYISNKTIRTIQDIINYYLVRFNVSLQVLINGYTLLKNGDLREKIQIWVIKNGKERVLFKALSKGQRGRAALCSVIALSRLLNNSSDGNGLAFLGLDEFLEGLDASGQDSAIHIMEQLKMTSLLILHHAENIKCKNKVIVKKENGISKLII